MSSTAVVVVPWRARSADIENFIRPGEEKPPKGKPKPGGKKKPGSKRPPSKKKRTGGKRPR